MNGAPINSGISVPDKLITWIKTTRLPQDTKDKAMDLVLTRDAFGREKYGQSLMTKDGRITVLDALEELGDLLQYLYKAKLNDEDMTKVKELVPVLLELIK